MVTDGTDADGDLDLDLDLDLDATGLWDCGEQ